MPLLRPRGCPGGVRGSCSHAGTAGHKAGVHPLSTLRFACTGPALAAPAAPPPVLPSPAQRRNLQAASPTWGEDEPLSVAFWESCGVAAAQGPQTRRGAKGRAGGGGGHRSSLTALSCCWSPPASSAQAQTATICPFSLPASPPNHFIPKGVPGACRPPRRGDDAAL